MPETILGAMGVILLFVGFFSLSSPHINGFHSVSEVGMLFFQETGIGVGFIVSGLLLLAIDRKQSSRPKGTHTKRKRPITSI
ncbi:hypothetical protein HYV84_02005 [Candidatus Woesearchaeota archaeon]|nr:hypothetical protein [Candidatus Woesearchaeota archaeon]